uniref:Dihydrofolate synthase/folylpolyglutamate synthase n=1 Tax=Schlesneria paludicola TaxID=360056 RepID=A0A7C2JWL5_9PLAN
MSQPLDTYEQAIEFLFGRINYERTQPDAYSTADFKLDRMRHLLEAAGNPHQQLPAVHVAGTKGKGSTCAMLASLLRAAGKRTGLYISPHLVRFEERMTVDGVSPSPTELVALVNRLLGPIAEMDRSPVRMHPTYFEIATVLAWRYFLDRQADVAVLETGLGGRLDSTNLCHPWVTVITNVSRDHTHILGSTVREIAFEKAGIMKPGVPCVSGCLHVDARQVMLDVAAERGVPLWQLERDVHWRWQDRERRMIAVDTPARSWSELPVTLRGEHQAANTALVVAAADCLSTRDVPLSPETVRAGLQAVHWPARIEVVGESPTVILDAAHNWESTRALLQTLSTDFRARRKLLIFACSRDKDHRGLLRQLTPHFDSLIFTRFQDNPRSVSPDELGSFVETISEIRAHRAADPYSAWKLARRLAHADDLIVITGSLFLVAELRELVLETCRPGIDSPPVPTPETPSHAVP